MDKFDQALLIHLRSMAREGATASQILRYSLREFAPQKPHTIALLKLMRAAFSLSLSEAKPVAGWYGVEEGGLTDEQLDGFVDPEIRRHRSEWDPARAC